MRLKIEGEFVDQFEDTVIAQTFQANDLRNISKRQGGLSNKFKLPTSSKNSRLLGFSDDINSSSDVAYTKIEAELFDDGSFLSNGYVRISNADARRGVFDITFFSDNSNWITDIKGKTLRDANLAEFDHTLTATVIKNSMEGTITSGFQYAFAEYGATLNEPINTFDQVDFDLVGSPFYPAVFVHSIVSAIYNDIGWTVGGELYDDVVFNRMVIPFAGALFGDGAGQVDVEEQLSPFDPVTAISTSVFGTTITVNSSNDLSPNESNSRYSIEFSFDIEIDSACTGALDNTFNARVTVNGTPVLVGSDTVNCVFDNGEKNVTRITGNVVNVLSSDTVRVECYRSGSGPNDINVLGGFLKYKTDYRYQQDETVEINKILPVMSQVDFIKYIFTSFGVIPVGNNKNKKLTLSLIENIRTNDSIDWSSKIDLSKKTVLSYTDLLKNYGNSSVLKYKDTETSDMLYGNYLDQYSESFGQGAMDLNNETLEGVKVIYTAPFSASFMVGSFVGNLQAMFIETFDSDGNASDTPSPRIAIITPAEEFDDLTGGKLDSIRIQPAPGGGTTVVVLKTPILYFSKMLINSFYDQYTPSLSYGHAADSGFNFQGSFVEDYLSETERFLSKSKLIQYFFLLTDVDINNLDFAQSIFIDRFKSYFYLSKIKNYRGSNQSTEVELIKIP